ncbi:MAG: tryptophan--tRNA ligase [bacterium]
METLVSGMRPTGKLHIGHIFGALKNWKEYQDKYKSYFIIVDWHALTTNYQKTHELQDHIKEVMIDYLAFGIDPNKAVIYLQSMVKDVAVLHLILSMIVPLSWLERVPTFKDQIKELGKDIATYGFFGYPVLMSADILAFNASTVPVGEDQLPHLELTREIARRFNYLYGPTFTEPKELLTNTPYIPGFDGRKMSKSYNNAIFIDDDEKTIKEKVMKYITDPNKIYKNSPGRPEICNVFSLHKAFENPEINEIEENCKKGNLGCVECKLKLCNMINNYISPIRDKRKQIEKNKDDIIDILKEGSKKASEVVANTLNDVYYKLNLKGELIKN